MPQPRILQILWCATADNQYTKTYTHARQAEVLAGLGLTPVSSRQIEEDVREFESLCHEDWARHRDVLIGEQDRNSSPWTIVYVSPNVLIRYECRFDREHGWLVVDRFWV